MPLTESERVVSPETPTTWRRRLGRRLAAVDAVVIAGAGILAYWVRNMLGTTGVAGQFASEVPVAVGVIPLWLLILYWVGAYRPEYLNSGGDAFRRFAAGSVAGILAVGFVSFAFNLQLSRLYVAILWLLIFVAGTAVRLGLRTYLSRQFNRGLHIQRVLIVGADTEGQELAQSIASTRHTGYRIEGFLDDTLPLGEQIRGLQVLGRTTNVLREALRRDIGLVVVSPSGLPAGTLRDVTVALEGSDVDLAVAPSLFQVVTRRVMIESVANIPILHVDQIRLRRGKAFAKRTLDLAVASLLGVVLLPVTLAAAVAIRLHDGGSTLFRQTRVGRDGREFTVLKFRTMREGADRQVTEINHLNEAGDKFFKIRDDPRVTAPGRLLRSWSIDEIPQLWNVLRGDMSMVGPRPPLPEEVARYGAWEHRRLRVRPGITGVWQTSGRSDVPFDEAVRLDLFYIENWSLGYDLFLLGKTVAAVLSRRGAY